MATDWATLFDRMDVWALDGPARIEGALALEPGAAWLTVWAVAVDPARQGEGLGGALLDFAETRARQLGHREVRLFTNLLMIRNQEIYAARGYRETHREVTPRYTAVHMAKAV